MNYTLQFTVIAMKLLESQSLVQYCTVANRQTDDRQHMRRFVTIHSRRFFILVTSIDEPWLLWWPSKTVFVVLCLNIMCLVVLENKLSIYLYLVHEKLQTRTDEKCVTAGRLLHTLSSSWGQVQLYPERKGLQFCDFWRFWQKSLNIDLATRNMAWRKRICDFWHFDLKVIVICCRYHNECVHCSWTVANGKILMSRLKWCIYTHTVVS